jgi:tRNA(Ile2) C34 agmatinyltransferase TiaS
MPDTDQKAEFTFECPHCHKSFDADVVQGAGRIRGFKCPHCRLFVPYERVAEQALTRDPDATP